MRLRWGIQRLDNAPVELRAAKNHLEIEGGYSAEVVEIDEIIAQIEGLLGKLVGDTPEDVEVRQV